MRACHDSRSVHGQPSARMLSLVHRAIRLGSRLGTWPGSIACPSCERWRASSLHCRLPCCASSELFATVQCHNLGGGGQATRDLTRVSTLASTTRARALIFSDEQQCDTRACRTRTQEAARRCCRRGQARGQLARAHLQPNLRKRQAGRTSHQCDSIQDCGSSLRPTASLRSWTMGLGRVA